MHHFFADPSQIGEKEIVLTGPDVNHIRQVLRMKAGEEIQVSGGQGKEYRCMLERLEPEAVYAKIMWILESEAELPCEITLFQGLPKSDKMEWIVQKCVELGVRRIVPVRTRRCVVKLDEKKEQNKRKRWAAIAESAAKQSGRGLVPEILEIQDFSEALSEAEKLDICLLPYELAQDMEQTRRLFGRIKPGQSIGIFIGPEGGFEESEVEQAVRAGAHPVTLGKRILRTETAGMAVLSMLSFCLEGRQTEAVKNREA